MASDPGVWFSVAMFLLGLVVAGLGMLIREDTMGRKYADEAKKLGKERNDQLAAELDMAEKRLNERINREMGVIGRELKEIKEFLVRLENRVKP